SDRRGAFSRLNADGKQELFGAGTTCFGEPLLVNGFDLERSGSALVTHLGDDSGGVWRLTVGGELVPVIVEADGEVLPATNFVRVDEKGRIWATVSTRARPRTRARTAARADGFIVMMDSRGTRIVADRLSF